MTNVFRTMIVEAAVAPLAREIAAALSPAGVGMFVSGLVSVAGPAEAGPTHYVSTGMIDAQFAPLLQDGAALHATAAAAGVECTLQACQDLVARAHVSELPPFEAFAELELQLHQPAEVLA
jgi:hypothetical protein